MIKTCTLLFSLSLAFGVTPAEAAGRPIVVELFTSEGCSSCPPADALLAQLASRPEVLALSFHVDYWDRLGWKDPFSMPAATRRQSRYAELLGIATVYTPQIVVDGKWQAIGSDSGEVGRALDAARRDADEVAVALSVDHGHARIKVGIGSEGVSGTVLLVGFDRRRVSAVMRGENGGRTLTHVDVVRNVEEVGQSDSRAKVIEVPIGSPADRFAAIVQARDGRILGAAVSDADAGRDKR
jgi:hypothetical protein